MLYGPNKSVRFVVQGSLLGTGQRKLIWRKNDRQGTSATDLTSVTVPSGATGSFCWDITLHKVGVSGDFRGYGTFLMSGQTPIITSEYVTGVDLTHDWLFRLYKEDDVAGLNTQIVTREIYVAG